MLLFLIFTICSLIIISIAANTYSRINKGFEQTFNYSASVRYISNKIRSSDNCEIIDGGSSIAVYYDGIVSIIYCNDGGLYEKTVTENSDDIKAVGGDKIFDVQKINITQKNDGLYTISAISENDVFGASCRVNG